MYKLGHRGFSVIELSIIVVFIGLLGGAGWFVFQQNSKPQPSTITNFEECKAAGNPVMESSPEQCSANGQTYINTLGGAQDQVSDSLSMQVCAGEICIKTQAPFDTVKDGKTDPDPKYKAYNIAKHMTDKKTGDSVSLVYNQGGVGGYCDPENCHVTLLSVEDIPAFPNTSLIKYVREYAIKGQDTLISYHQDVINNKTLDLHKLTIGERKSAYIISMFDVGDKSCFLTFATDNEFKSVEDAKNYANSANARVAADIQKSIAIK